MLKIWGECQQNLPNTSFRDDHFNDHDWVGGKPNLSTSTNCRPCLKHHLPTLQATRLSTSQASLALRKTKLSAEKAVLLQEVGMAFATFRP